MGIFTDAAGITHGFSARKEQFRGTASRVGEGEANAAVQIDGSFTSLIDLALSDATLTITSLLNEQAGPRAASSPPSARGTAPARRASRLADGELLCGRNEKGHTS